MRYRLSTLLVAMVWVGLVCLALRSPNYWWSGGMFALLVLVLLTSVLVAIYRTGPLRAMAIGFFVFSAGFLVVERYYVPSEELAGWAFDQVHHRGKATAWEFVAFDPDDPDFRQSLYGRFQAFKGVCTSAIAVLVGVMGGIIAQALCHTQPGDRRPPAVLSG